MPPRVDPGLCNGCGICVELCSEDVFFGTPGFGKIHMEKAVVSLKEEKVTVTGDADTASLLKAIREEGYEAQLL